MAKINWKNSSGGDFANPSNWSTGTVPVSSSIANINASGTGTYTVTSSANETVLALTTIPTATLDLTGGLFTALAGTGVGANAGTIKVENNVTFAVGGTVNNSGNIIINATPGPANTIPPPGGVLSIYRDTILQGGGKITLSNYENGGTGCDIVPASSGGATLTNVDNTISTISGYGAIGVPLVNEKNGVIDANGSSVLGVGPTVTNAGVLEATSGGELAFGNGATITNIASGVIGAFGAGSIVAIESASSLSGGTLKTTGGGQILISSSTIDGSNGHAVTNTGSLIVGGDYLLGTIDNTGTITLNGGTLAVAAGGATINNTGTIALNGAAIPVGAGGLTFAGSGSVTFNDSSSNIIAGTGTSTTLTNQNTISGAVEIGGQGLLLTNQGVIDANGTNPLTVDTGASVVTNSGTMEATNNGELFVASNVTNTGHLIAANNGTDIFAGAVSGTGTATVQGAGSIEFGSTTTANITFAAGAAGTVTFDDASSLTGKVSITGFTLGDTIDLADIKYGSSGPSLTFTKGLLTVSDGTDVAKLNMIGNFTLASFHAAPDGSGGTLITDPPLLGSAPSTSPPGLDHVVALFNQSIAAGFSDQQQHGVINTNPLSQIVTNQEQFLAQPHHG
jgi:hypothetical protein